MEHRLESMVDKWISRVWSVVFTLIIGVTMFGIAFASSPH